MDFNVARASGATPSTIMSVGYNTHVGIGTTSPDERLHVTGGGIRVDGEPTIATNSGAGLFFGYGSNVAKITALDQGVAWKNLRLNAAEHEFYIAGGQQAKLDSSGNLLLGAATANDSSSSMGGQTPDLYVPGYTSLGGLRIKGTDGANTIYQTGTAIGITVGDTNLITLSNSNSTARLSTGNWEVLSGGSLRAYRGGNSAYAALFMDTAENLYIRNSWGMKDIVLDREGRVGIGTADPEESLHVKGDGARIYVDSADYHIAMIGRRGSSGASLDQGYLRLKDQGANKVVLDTAGNSFVTGGNFGVGTDTPAAPLVVMASSGAANLRLVGRSSDNISSLDFFNNAQTASSYIQGNGSWQRARADNGFHFARNATPNVTDTDGFTIENLNVGIGTTSPYKSLEVAGDIQLDATDANIWIKSGAAGTNGFINWTFNTDDTVYNKIGMDYDTRATTGFHIDAGYPITIDASASGGKAITFAISGTTKAVIDNTGFFGVGTSDPLDLIHIRSTSTDARQIIEGHTGYDAELKFSEGGTVKYTIGHDAASDNFVIGTTNVDTEQRLVINSTGNVGIGTTSPDRALEVSTDGTAQLKLTRVDTTINNQNLLGTIEFAGQESGTSGIVSAEIQAIADNTWSSGVYDSALRFWTGKGSYRYERVRIDSDGKVIIGDQASHTDDLLQIETPASGGGHGIQIRRNDSNNDQGIGRIMFGNNTDTDLASIYVKTDGATDSGAITFNTQPTGGAITERMRIHSSGKVTITNSNYASHLELVRGSESVYLTVSAGQLLTNGGVSPDVTNQDDLGRSDKYWENLWLGTSLKMGGTTVIDSSRNLTNIGTISSGAITINSNNDDYNFKAKAQDSDSWFGVYDDANNSANIIVTRSDTTESFKHLGHTGETVIKASGTGLRIESTDNEAIQISGNGGGLNFQTGTNQRIYFNSYRAMEGNNNGTSLQIAEGYSVVQLQANMVVHGHLTPSANNTMDLGSSDMVWRDLYIGDLNLNNETRVNDDGTTGNEIDGTTGNWTVQEGEEHLYLINNKNGKKYKFCLEEIE
jgi:hypothetical protein